MSFGAVGRWSCLLGIACAQPTATVAGGEGERTKLTLPSQTIEKSAEASSARSAAAVAPPHFFAGASTIGSAEPEAVVETELEVSQDPGLSRPPHPGTIVFIDGLTKQVTDTVQASEVPLSVQYAPSGKDWIPVVKVVAFETEDRRVIREYGPDGAELRSTIQVRKGR